MARRRQTEDGTWVADVVMTDDYQMIMVPGGFQNLDKGDLVEAPVRLAEKMISRGVAEYADDEEVVETAAVEPPVLETAATTPKKSKKSKKAD